MKLTMVIGVVLQGPLYGTKYDVGGRTGHDAESVHVSLRIYWKSILTQGPFYVMCRCSRGRWISGIRHHAAKTIALSYHLG